MNGRIYRTIDANINRLTEGLRVCEDIARFILLDKVKTQKFKLLRHRASSACKKFDNNKNILVKFRYPQNDVGKKTTENELKRENVSDIFNANIKRAEESARVLEEFAKLTDAQLSNKFKTMRFELYSLEKGIVKKLRNLRNN